MKMPLSEIIDRYTITLLKSERTDMPLDEVGRLAIKVRELNQIRNGIKGEIVDEFAEGFKEIKVNYTKVDYGRSD